MTLTENGALTYRSTLSHCLDLFLEIGALREAEAGYIIWHFIRAYAEDPDIAMRILFYARDVRGGLGERRVFRVLLRYLAEYEKKSVIKNLDYIAEYGRYDDLLSLIGTRCENEVIELIEKQLALDIKSMEEGGRVSLLAKWLPSVNTSNADTVKQAKRIARLLKMSCKKYRKTLSALRAYIKIIENPLRERDYSFDYSKQPSRAMLKYRRAFIRNDGERYGEYIRAVSENRAKMNTGTLMPYDIVRPALKRNMDKAERESLDAAWNALEDFTTDENAIVVMDGSGSMYWDWYEVMPATVALSLAIYFAERSRGAFGNKFITFSKNPQLVDIKGRDIFEKVRYCESFNEAANTDLDAVFRLLLGAAVMNNVPQSELPSTIYIITDMEFDLCVDDADTTNYESAKKRFEEKGYRLPNVVFWNVASRALHTPVLETEEGVALVSGCSPRVFSMVMGGELSPRAYMMSVLDQERYKRIGA